MNVRLEEIDPDVFIFLIGNNAFKFNNGNYLVIMPSEEFDIDENNEDIEDRKFTLFICRVNMEGRRVYSYVPSKDRYINGWVKFIQDIIKGVKVEL